MGEKGACCLCGKEGRETGKTEEGEGGMIRYHIAGYLCKVQIFATHNQNAKIRTTKYETAKI